MSSDTLDLFGTDPALDLDRRTNLFWETSGMEVSKLHGLGNDFLVSFTNGSAELAREICDRHSGVGADGLILGGWTSTRELTFRLWNPDGSEAETSGNGLRCLAHAALDAGEISQGTPIRVVTPAGLRQVSIRRTGRSLCWSVVEMGSVRIEEPVEAPGEIGYKTAFVNAGNPHLVVSVPDPRSLDLLAAIRDFHNFGVVRNVEFVTVGPGANALTMRIWERGVGETQACGTGSCAAAVVFHRWGLVGRTVIVHQPGGALGVRLGRDDNARLSGPSVFVAKCTVE